MKKTILLLLLSLITNVSFSQSQKEKEAIEFLDTHLKKDTLKLGANFNGNLKYDKDKLNYHMNIKTFHPFDSKKLVMEIDHSVSFSKADIKDYFTEVREVDKEKGYYEIFAQVNLIKRLPMDYYSKMYTDEEGTHEIIEVIKVQISSHKELKKENIDEYIKALELLFKV